MNKLPLKILAVDNEELLLWALERAFKNRSLELSTATNIEQALSAIGQCFYDLYILDVDGQNQSQLQLLTWIDENCPFVPIIFTTACDTKSPVLKEKIKRLRRRGEWHLLGKPFDLEEIFRSIEKLFQNIECMKLGGRCLAHSYDHEKRDQVRNPHVQPIKFSFIDLIDGNEQEIKKKGIITDISSGGIGLLTDSKLKEKQVISFEDTLNRKFGIVSWCSVLDKQSCRVGIHLC